MLEKGSMVRDFEPNLRRASRKQFVLEQRIGGNRESPILGNGRSTAREAGSIVQGGRRRESRGDRAARSVQPERIGKYLAAVLLPLPPAILHIAAGLGIHLEVQQSQCLLPTSCQSR